MREETPFPEVRERLRRFILSRTGSKGLDFALKKLRGDASTRQYFRWHAEPESTILTVYPEPFDPENLPYLEVYRLLRRIQIPTPKILALAGELGIIEQEDLGDLLLSEWLGQCSPQKRLEWLRKAIDFMIRIQLRGPGHSDPDAAYYGLAFDSEKLFWELSYFARNFLTEYCGFEANANLSDEFGRISREMASYPRVLCHRDYQCRNLMVHEEALYVIDFQDARWGPSSYDLASLLQDSISLAREEREELVNYFLTRRTELNADEFAHQLSIVTVQRLLKALGTFGHQISVRGLERYEQFVPGALARVSEVLRKLSGFPAITESVERAVEFSSRLESSE